VAEWFYVSGESDEFGTPAEYVRNVYEKHYAPL
jgi:hypothetical protein